MAAAAERPDIREQVGVAVNASSLVMRAEGGETSLDRVAGLGAAAAVVASGQDRSDDPLASAQADMRPLKEKDAIEAELGPMLWHLRYGQQHGGLSKAIALFALWLGGQHQMEDKRAHLVAFSARVLHEWLSDRCIACGGSGKLQRLGNGNLVRPRGSMQRNAVYSACRACGGGGRAAVSHVERARGLGLDREHYDATNWPRAFNSAAAWIDNIARRIRRPLTAELERRKRHAGRA